MPRQIRAVAEDALGDTLAQTLADSLFSGLLISLVPAVAQETLLEEGNRRDKEELEQVAFMEYLDRCIMEALIGQMAEESTEGEERQRHTQELIEKKKRVSRSWGDNKCIG